MLDVTFNQSMNMNCASSFMTSGNSLVDEVVDPLFDNDWLQEHNLDVLFDLFEEEIERKDFVDGAGAANSSSIFGTSPVTSYLFSASPSLASAIDLYDWLYFENQQPTSTLSSQMQQANVTSATSSSSTGGSISNENNRRQSATFGFNNSSDDDTRINHKSGTSVTDAMKIKRKLRRGQSEGISLLARPLASNSGINNSCIDRYANGVVNRGSNSLGSVTVNKSKSDNISARLLNSKKLLGEHSDTKPINIDRSKQKDCHSGLRIPNHQLHHITGCAIIREHAYAIQGL